MHPLLLLFADVPPTRIRFEESDYTVSEEHGEFEVCVLADGLSEQVGVLVEAVSLTAQGQYQYKYKIVALMQLQLCDPQTEMISPLQLQHWSLKNPVFVSV